MEYFDIFWKKSIMDRNAHSIHKRSKWLGISGSERTARQDTGVATWSGKKLKRNNSM